MMSAVPPDPRCLFVYGTLMPELARRGAVPEDVIGGLRYCTAAGAATVAGTLYDCGPFPALVAGGGGRVGGRVLTLPADAAARARLLRVLDGWEGVADELFRRVVVEATTAGGEAVACWAWTYARDTVGLPAVESGDWLAYNTGR